jgi:hypothetical protein
MESIRSTGGFSSSGLKHIDINAGSACQISLKSSKEKTPASKQALGYDYRNELAVQLQKRRRGKN